MVVGMISIDDTVYSGVHTGGIYFVDYIERIPNSNLVKTFCIENDDYGNRVRVSNSHIKHFKKVVL